VLIYFVGQKKRRYIIDNQFIAFPQNNKKMRYSQFFDMYKSTNNEQENCCTALKIKLLVQLTTSKANSTIRRIETKGQSRIGTDSCYFKSQLQDKKD